MLVFFKLTRNRARFSELVLYILYIYIYIYILYILALIAYILLLTAIDWSAEVSKQLVGVVNIKLDSRVFICFKSGYGRTSSFCSCFSINGLFEPVWTP